jgi:hypothetical protein
MMYPNEPMYISCFLPRRSINAMPTNVNRKLIKPIPALPNSEAVSKVKIETAFFMSLLRLSYTNRGINRVR